MKFDFSLLLGFCTVFVFWIAVQMYCLVLIKILAFFKFLYLVEFVSEDGVKVLKGTK